MPVVGRVRTLAIFGTASDPQVCHVRDAARARGHEVILLSPAYWRGDGLEPHAIFVSGEDVRIAFDELDPLSADAAWIRHLPPPFPPIDVRPELPPLDRRDTHVAMMNARERASAVLAVVDALILERRPVINPPAPGLGMQNKLTQLITLARGGLRVPETLVSDDPEEVRRFAKGRRVVFKPATGGALARELDEQMLGAIDLIKAAPVIFQEMVTGEDVRATVVDDRVVSAVIVETPEGTVDFRSDPTYAAGQGTYREVELPGFVEEAVKAAARVLGLRFAGIDVRLVPEKPEAYAILEANPSPTYLDVEVKMGHPITAALIDALVS